MSRHNNIIFNAYDREEPLETIRTKVRQLGSGFCDEHVRCHLNSIFFFKEEEVSHSTYWYAIIKGCKLPLLIMAHAGRPLRFNSLRCQIKMKHPTAAV